MKKDKNELKISKSIVATDNAKIKKAKIKINKNPMVKKNPKKDGSNIYSYISAFVVVICFLGLFFNILDIKKSILLLIAGVIFLYLIVLSQLFNDNIISEKGFVEVSKIILKKINPLSGIISFFSKKNLDD